VAAQPLVFPVRLLLVAEIGPHDVDLLRGELLPFGDAGARRRAEDLVAGLGLSAALGLLLAGLGHVQVCWKEGRAGRRGRKVSRAKKEAGKKKRGEKDGIGHERRRRRREQEGYHTHSRKRCPCPSLE